MVKPPFGAFAGRLISGLRCLIATRFGSILPGPQAELDFIRAACDASLKRLNTNYIDLYQFHVNEYGPEGAEEVREALESLMAASKIRTFFVVSVQGC
jgi:aryl-alcohol dehydrogenase-like predicted oxidoreductase